MIFVDTNIWFTAYVTSKENREFAVDLIASHEHLGLVVTDYIVDELLTLARARGYKEKATRVGELLLQDHIATVIHVSEEDFHKSWQLFRDYHDKEWSFTDCTCKVVMDRLGITKALSFDDHFRQFGDIEVLPKN